MLQCSRAGTSSVKPVFTIFYKIIADFGNARNHFSHFTHHAKIRKIISEIFKYSRESTF